MNIMLSYLYRDAGNYKNFNEVVFTNDSQLPLDEIERRLKACLIDKEWFVADKWGLKDLHFTEFAWNSELDHDWHEFESIEETEEAVTEEIDIVKFLEKVEGR
jgi:hypothetical protein